MPGLANKCLGLSVRYKPLGLQYGPLEIDAWAGCLGLPFTRGLGVRYKAHGLQYGPVEIGGWAGRLGLPLQKHVLEVRYKPHLLQSGPM